MGQHDASEADVHPPDLRSTTEGAHEASLALVHKDRFTASNRAQRRDV